MVKMAAGMLLDTCSRGLLISLAISLQSFSTIPKAYLSPRNYQSGYSEHFPMGGMVCVCEFQVTSLI